MTHGRVSAGTLQPAVRTTQLSLCGFNLEKLDTFLVVLLLKNHLMFGASSGPFFSKQLYFFCVYFQFSVILLQCDYL